MRVSIITGGGAGIGAAVARRLAAPEQCLMLHGQGADAAGLERLKAVAMACNGSLDAADIHEVGADADDHDCCSILARPRSIAARMRRTAAANPTKMASPMR